MNNDNELIIIQSPASTQRLVTPRKEFIRFWEPFGWLYIDTAKPLPGFDAVADWGSKTQSNKPRMF